MKLLPLEDRVIIEPEERADKSPGGIIIPPNAKEKPQVGKVLAVGKGRWVDDKVVPMELKVGDMVFYPKFAGSEIEVDRKELLIIKESEILARIK